MNAIWLCKFGVYLLSSLKLGLMLGIDASEDVSFLLDLHLTTYCLPTNRWF